MDTNEQINWEWLFREKAVLTYFQPIVSIRKQEIIGLEALSRGLTPAQEIIMPQQLFTKAAQQGKELELDRLCREKALYRYRQMIEEGCEALLFLNLNTAILDQGIVGSGHLINTVNRLGLTPSSIVIEVVESKLQDTESLGRFIDTYKKLGFLIALDDTGRDASNLDRILQVRPDIIKIDRGIVSEIHSDYYKQELFKALVLIAKKTGALIVAEGVETREEALACLELGADFLQGYYFSRPVPLNQALSPVITETLHSLAAAHRSSRIDQICSAIQQKTLYESTLRQLAGQLAACPPASYEDALKALTAGHPRIQCCYLLDAAGLQITETLNVNGNPDGNRHEIFRPAAKGSDQSFKDYYFYIHAGCEKYISDPYVSLANGRLCVTGSILFRSSPANAACILCVDFSL